MGVQIDLESTKNKINSIPKEEMGLKKIQKTEKVSDTGEDLKKEKIHRSPKKSSSGQKHIHDLEKKLQQLQTQIEQEKLELNDKYLRLAADFDNYRRRTEREVNQILQYAGENILRNILPVVDDLERALNNSEIGSTADSLRSGIELISKKFEKTLKELGVEAFNSLHRPFDPHYHHAMMVKETPEVDPDTVIEEFEKGYMFKDRVLRHAKVVVSK
jgi:molecular chaperone GrpE